MTRLGLSNLILKAWGSSLGTLVSDALGTSKSRLPAEADTKVAQHLKSICPVDTELVTDVRQWYPSLYILLVCFKGNEFCVMRPGVGHQPTVSTPGKFILGSR